jgi:RNA polymerase sigma factor (sigma-70 family)
MTAVDPAAPRADVPGIVNHLFRHKAGEMVSQLTRLFGVERMELAEDVVQEALCAALQLWPYRGIPDNPGGWLATVARNKALDVLRREAVLRRKLERARSDDGSRVTADPGTGAVSYVLHPDQLLEDPFGDDQLTMMFLCCHPCLAPQAQIALTLKTVGGFGIDEIARAFLASPQTIAQRLVRAKRRLRARKVRFELPPGGELAERMQAVLRILYLFFNEGYTASAGRDLVRADICLEAIRLATLLADARVGDLPEVHALCALMLFQASRFETRTDAEGNLLLMAEQDRTRWDAELIREGFTRLERAAAGGVLSEYHLLAGISSCHAAARSFEETDWRLILFYYNELVSRYPSPVAELNRAVAIAMVEGPRAGIAALDGILPAGGLRSYHLLPATYADLYERAGEGPTAAAFYRRALAGAKNEAEMKFLKSRIERCERVDSAHEERGDHGR